MATKSQNAPQGDAQASWETLVYMLFKILKRDLSLKY
jgi:hypothetical protein